MQVAVGSVEVDEVCVGWEVVEEVEQREARNAYSIFEHFDVPVAVECGLFCDGFEKGFDVTVVIPDEIVPHRRHPVVTPHGLARSVIGVGDAFAREATEEGRLRRQSAILQLTQVVHVLIGKVAFLLRATVRFQVFIVAETGRKIIANVNELQLVGG